MRTAFYIDYKLERHRTSTHVHACWLVNIHSVVTMTVNNVDLVRFLPVVRARRPNLVRRRAAGLEDRKKPKVTCL